MRDIFGHEYTSRLNSFLVWRKHLDDFRKLENKTGKRFPTRSELIKGISTNGICPVCNDIQTVYSEGEKYYCICYLMDYLQLVEERLGKYRTNVRDAKLQDLEIWGNTKLEAKSLELAIKESRRFIEDPRKWLVLSGMYGCGKTHMLQSIASAFGPFAFYLSAADFEQMVFATMNIDVLSEFMWGVERAPILLIDDWGTEYGSDLIKAKFRQIIDFRYNLFPEYPVALATNLLPEMAYEAYDSRVASRLFDKSRSAILKIDVGDYRICGGIG
jgi:DNA replication protein DnaC